MISYAPKEGGIGPHVDNYDVFLLQVQSHVHLLSIHAFIHTQPKVTDQTTPAHQGRGTRRWRIQGALLGGKEEREGLIPNSPVRILANFQEDHAWVLEPGDMLYLPPRWVAGRSGVGLSLLVGGAAARVWGFRTAAPTYSPKHHTALPHGTTSVPHDGVSLDGDCMTYSIGFRAPAQRELLAAAATAAQALLEGDGCVRTCFSLLFS